MIQSALETLQNFVTYTDEHPQQDILSIYLLVDPADPENQSATPAWQVYLKNAIAEIEANLDSEQTKQWKKVRLSDTSPRTEWARIRKRLNKYLSSYTPKGKTLALFIGPDGEFRYELPLHLRNSHYYGQPHIQEYLWALDEFEQHLVLLFAEDKTRAVSLFLGDTTDDVTVTSDQTWQRKVHKSAHAQNIDHRHLEYDRRYINSVAKQVNKYFLQNPDINRIVLGGNMEMAHAVLKSLHTAAAERVIGLIPIPINTPTHEIATLIRPVAEQAERDYETHLVNEIVAQAKAGGRGALGQEAVDKALSLGSVQLLAIAYPGELDIVEDMFLQAASSQSRVEFVEGEAAEKLKEEGGLAARLYYAVG